MYKSFLEYKEIRENEKFCESLLALFESINNNGSFNDWWTNIGLKTFIENLDENLDVLVEDLTNSTMPQNPQGTMPQGPQGAMPQKDPYRGLKANTYEKANQALSQVMPVFQEFMNKLSELRHRATTHQDKYLYQVVSKFMEKASFLGKLAVMKKPQERPMSQVTQEMPGYSQVQTSV